MKRSFALVLHLSALQMSYPLLLLCVVDLQESVNLLQIAMEAIKPVLPTNSVLPYAATFTNLVTLPNTAPEPLPIAL